MNFADRVQALLRGEYGASSDLFIGQAPPKTFVQPECIAFIA